MTSNETIDRLLTLAQARLKLRLGAFEQFENTVRYTAPGEAIKAAACEMPRAWHQALSLGIDGAGQYIDAHLMAVVDRWAEANTHTLAVAPIGGLSITAPVAAKQGDTRAVQDAPDGKSLPTKKRRDLLTPIIENAQRQCQDPNDSAAVWLVLTAKAEQAAKPFVGVTDDGLKWLDANDETRFFKLKNLYERINRKPKKTR